MNDIYKQAVEIHKATGKPYREVFQALKDHPPKASKQPSTRAAAEPAGPKQYKQTAFWKAVDKRMFERKEPYTAAYKSVRRESPQLWEQMIEEVNS